MRSRWNLICFVAIAIVPFYFSGQAFAGDKPGGEEIVAKNLTSVGAPDVWSSKTVRSAEGSALMDMLSGGQGHMQGTMKFLSQGNQYNFLMHFGASDYLGEQFKFDGDKPTVASNSPEGRWYLAEFVFLHDLILREGLWGSVLNSDWALTHLEARGAQIKFKGMRKISGKQLEEFVYIPKKTDRELTIKLYFDPDTSRHVRSVYSFSGQALQSGGQANYNTSQQIEMSLTEEFDDFRPESGMTLPHTWRVFYESPQQSLVVRWTMNVKSVSLNQPAAPAPKAAPAPTAAAPPVTTPAATASPKQN